eukprot:jgi/Chrzof1/10806/Cz05g12220.t1
MKKSLHLLRCMSIKSMAVSKVQVVRLVYVVFCAASATPRSAGHHSVTSSRVDNSVHSDAYSAASHEASFLLAEASCAYLGATTDNLEDKLKVVKIKKK